MLFFTVICFLFLIIIFRKYIILFFRGLSAKRHLYIENKYINTTYKKDWYLKREVVNNFNVYFNCTLKQAANIKLFLNTLPSFLGESFSNNNYEMRFLVQPVFKKELSKMGQNMVAWDGTKILGNFNPFNKSIIINTNLSNEIVLRTIAHELGHFCDWFLGPSNFVFLSMRDRDVLDELKRMKEYEYFDIDKYYLSNPKEFLAFSISHFLTDKLFLSENMKNISEKYLLLLKENY